MARTDKASRLIDASPQRLYRAFLDPQALAAWLPPAGMTGEVQAFEPCAGGAYRMTLTHENAEHSPRGKSTENSDLVEGRFVELLPDRRIVQEATFRSDDPAFAGTMTITWTFTAVPGGTEVAIVCENVPDGIGKEDHDSGLRSSLANLAAFAEQNAAGAGGRG